jgi:hypothetical protein
MSTLQPLQFYFMHGYVSAIGVPNTHRLQETFR